jgi:hypothetical protein
LKTIYTGYPEYYKQWHFQVHTLRPSEISIGILFTKKVRFQFHVTNRAQNLVTVLTFVGHF